MLLGQSFTVSEVLSIGGALLTACTVIAGGAWWMSALYGKVRTMASCLSEIRMDLHTRRNELESIRRHLDRQDSDLSRICTKLKIPRKLKPSDSGEWL